jgi:hypothetical protein
MTIFDFPIPTVLSFVAPAIFISAVFVRILITVFSFGLRLLEVAVDFLGDLKDAFMAFVGLAG